MKNIDTIHIEITDKCNLSCHYCYQKYNTNKYFAYANSTCESQLNIIKNSDIFSVNITGGEPTLDNRLYNITKLFANDKNVTITTNGIKRINSLDGFNTIIVSMDGFLNEMILNRNIDEHQYELIEKNISYYLDAGKNVQLNVVITKQSMHQFGDFIKNNRFGNRLSYSIIVVSDKTLDTRFIIEDQDSLNFIENEIIEIYKFYDYHIQLKSNLMTKATFIDTFSEEYPITFFVTYSMPNNKYVYINEEFAEYEDLCRCYDILSKKITDKIIRRLEPLKPKDFFNPYSLAELVHDKNFCEV